MMERKTVRPRPRETLLFVYFAVTFTSAVVAGLVLVSPFFPPSVMEVPLRGISPAEPIPNIKGYTFPDISFQTPMLDSSRTYYGNVTLCCVFKELTSREGIVYFSSPELFVFADSDYSTRSTSNAEVSINGETFSNYTFNGSTGTEILSIQFTPKGSGVYHFVVNPGNNESQVYLYLSYYNTTTAENKWPSLFQEVFGVLSIPGLILGAMIALRTPRSREEKIQSALGR